MPSVIVMITLGLAFASAAAVGAATALSGSTRDHDTKAALAAADAGAQVALFRQNQVATTDSFPCVVEEVDASLGPIYVEGELNVNSNQGWCDPVQGTVGDASYEYEVSPPQLTDTVLGHQRRVSIVSTGTSDDVTRRVKVTAVAPTGDAIFGDAGVIGIDWVKLTGSASVDATNAAVGGVASNGDVFLEPNGQLCGDAQYGFGHELVNTGGTRLCGTDGEGTISLGTPVLPACASTGCDNARIEGGEDTASPSSAFVSGRISWDAQIGSLHLRSNATLTLGGANYVFCDLHLEGNSTLIVAGPAATRIYIRDPNDSVCDTDPNTAGHQAPSQPQFSMLGNSSVVSTNNDPSSAAVLMIGAADGSSTSADLSGNSKQNEFTLYAPRTAVHVTGSSTYLGMMAGKTLTFDGNGALEIPSSATNFNAEVLTTYVRERFVECTTSIPSGGAPDANC